MGENETTLANVARELWQFKASNNPLFHAVYIPEDNVDTSTENNTKGKSTGA